MTTRVTSFKTCQWWVSAGLSLQTESKKSNNAASMAPSDRPTGQCVQRGNPKREMADRDETEQKRNTNIHVVYRSNTDDVNVNST